MAGIRALFLANGAALGVFYPFIAVILAGRGFAPAAIGVVTAASSFAFTLAVPVWSHLADVALGRRVALALSGLGAAGCLVVAAAPVPDLVVAAAFVGFSTFECAWGPLGDAIAVNAVRDQARDYARVRLLSSVGFAITATGAGFVYDATGYGPAYLACAALAIVLVASTRFVPDLPLADLAAIRRRSQGGARGAAGGRRRGDGDRGRWVARRGGSFGTALRVEPRLGGALAAIFLVHLGVIAGWTFLPLRLVELGGQPSDVALSSAISAFAEIPGMLLAAALATRIGIRGMFAVCAAAYAACFASWIVIDVPVLIIATRVVTGLAFAGMWVGSVLTMSILLPPRLQGTGQGLYQVTAFGVAAVVANALGGVVYGSAGSGVLFGGALVLVLLGAVAVLAWLPRRGEAAMGEPVAALETPVPLVPGAVG